ncbi:MAG: hypothetical protein J5867_09510 [Prevotella sp.]|nr:hypothetical protein [Prevotella sp.]
MKRYLLAAIIMVLSSLTLHAEDYTYLTLQTKDGTTYSLAVSGLSITFSNGYMVASDGTSLQLSSLSKMYFSTSSDIHQLKMESAEGNVLVFNDSGVLLGTFPTLDRALSSLGKGLYVIKKSNGETNKVSVK